MYAFRRCASRFLTSRSASLVSSPRTYTSFVAPSQRIAQRSPAFHHQRRWATTESEKEGEAPISKLQPTGPEEVENAIQSEITEHSNAAEASQQTSAGAAPAVAESANLTEATDEALPAAETNERIVAQEAAPEQSAPAVAESANLTEATEEALPAAETNEQFVARDPPASAKALNFGADGFQKKQTIYVGNLFFDITESDLVKEFTRFGTISRCKIIRDSRGLSKGFAYVDFASVESAEEAVKTMNMQLYEGRRMTVQYAARSSQETSSSGTVGSRQQLNPPSKTLFIGNMSFEMTDRDLSNLFRGIRNVIDVRVAIDRRTGQPRGFAHADFIDVKSAMEAMKVLKDKETYGRRLRVDYSYSSSQAPRNQSGAQSSHPTETPAEPRS